MTEARSNVADAHVSAVLQWWTADARQLPWRQTRDVYAVWVSEMMLIQTQVDRVEPAWRAWIDRWPTVTQLAAASLADVLAQWQGLGYPRRARDLHLSAQIVARSGWPDDLTVLPGVGVYVDAAVRCFALEQPVLPIDVNTRRVLRRRFPDGVDSSDDPWRTGQALMEFGQRICTARPRCAECPVSDGCAGVGADPKHESRVAQRFEGSLRQRRGQLLRRVIADADPEAAASLTNDGLVLIADGWLLAPS